MRSASDDALLYHPKEAQIPFTDFFINCSHLVEWPAQLNPRSWILTHLQETAKTHEYSFSFKKKTFLRVLR